LKRNEKVVGSTVYKPAEDSYLLQRHVERKVRGVVLDMGTGSGIQAITAARKPEVTHVVAVDVNPQALEEARKNAVSAGVSGKIEFRLSDLFQAVEERFDYILFNPPYLPTHPEEPRDEAVRAWDGGPTGSEVIRRFLEEAKPHLRDGGRILLILSSLTGIALEEMAGDYEVEALEEEPLFFEELLCVSLRASTHGGKAT
jgi:release factor glutamine methyltransferase